MKNELEKIVKCTKCRRRLLEGDRNPYTFYCESCDNEKIRVEMQALHKYGALAPWIEAKVFYW